MMLFEGSLKNQGIQSGVVKVHLYEKKLGSMAELGHVEAREGRYSIELKDRKMLPAYILEVKDEHGKVLMTTDLRFNAANVNVIDLHAHKLQPLFILCHEALKELSTWDTWATLVDSDKAYIEGVSEIDIPIIDRYVSSKKLEAKVGLPAALFFAWLNRGLPGDISELEIVDRDKLKNSILEAIRYNEVPAMTDDEIERHLNHWENYRFTEWLDAPAALGDISKILSLVVDDRESQRVLLKVYLKSSTMTDFWEALKIIGIDDIKKEDLLLAFKLDKITGGISTLTKQLMIQAGKARSGNPIREIASWTKEKWTLWMDKHALPSTYSEIKKITAQDAVDLIPKYILNVQAILRSSYPTPVFYAQLAEQDLTFFKGQTRADLLSFLERNPYFDFESTASHLDDDSNLVNEPLQMVIHQVRRLFSLNKDLTLIDALLYDGLDSAFAISGLAKSDFVSRYTGVSGSGIIAEDVYRKASTIYTESLALWMSYQANLSVPLGVIPDNINRVSSADFDLVSMFGRYDGIETKHCSSVLGPSAYYADILNFLHQKSGELYEELKRRRPDLFTIDLTCGNSETLLPYIDLVNEALENQVLLHKDPSVPLPSSYQTTWSQVELSGSPEHINYAAYEELKKQVYPVTLPFNYLLEESRIVLDYLELPRHVLMSAFFTSRDNSAAFDDYANCIERLVLSPEEGSIITGEKTGNDTPFSGSWNFYGFDKPQNFKAIKDPIKPNQPITSGNWVTVLSGRIDIFLQQTGMSYKEMLTMLLCGSINPVRGTAPKISIVAKIIDEDGKPVPPDTSQLNLLELKGLEEVDLKVIHRFLRIYRQSGLSMYDLDKLFKVFGPLNGDVAQNKVLLQRIAQILYFQKLFRANLDELLAAWSDIGTRSYIDYFSSGYPVIPSLYEKLFKNRALVDTRNDIRGLPASDEHSVASVMGALEISFKQFTFLVQALNIGSKLSLKDVSLLYRYVSMARWLGLSLDDFIGFITLIGAELFKGPAFLFSFLHQFNTISASTFTFKEVSYLLNHATVANGIASANDVIGTFLSELRTALRAGELKGTENNETGNALREKSQKKVIVQKFSEQLGLTFHSVSLLLESYKRPGSKLFLIEEFVSVNLSSDLLKTYFLYGTQIEFEPIFVDIKPRINKEVMVTALFRVYSLMVKIGNIINRLKINELELENILQNRDYLKIIDLLALPVDPIKSADFNGFMSLLKIVEARNAVAPVSEKFLSVFTAENKKDWMAILLEVTGWEEPILELLIGNSNEANDAGLLKVTFGSDFRTGEFILRLFACINAIATLGTQTEIIKRLIDGNIVPETILTLRNAVKSRFGQNEWIDAIKPLRNELRERQRARLVSYLINKADPQKREMWSDANGLYEHLLIDVEMKPMVMTSRIRQAICSIQLFLDRVLMNLEFLKGDVSKPIPMNQEAVDSWKSLRRLYRVWEAGRKVLLYPENWLEPELRDNRSVFFTELETELKQDELIKPNIEQAFQNYLEKLDEIARLQIVGVLEEYEPRTYNEETGEFESEIDVLHVFGRTLAHPYTYFYRRFNQNEWSPWGRTELDIDSDHIVPIVDGRRLAIFWLFFTERHEERDKVDTSNIQTSDGYWKIQVAWSEYKRGKWGAKRLSKNSFESIRFSTIPASANSAGKTIKVQMEEFKRDAALFHGVLNEGFALVTNNREGYQIVGESTASDVGLLFRDLFHDPEIINPATQQGGGTISPEDMPKNVKVEKMRLVSDFGGNQPLLYYDQNNIAFKQVGGSYELSVPLSTASAGKSSRELTSGTIHFNWKPTAKYYFFADSKNTFLLSKKSNVSATVFTNNNGHLTYDLQSDAANVARISYLKDLNTRIRKDFSDSWYGQDGLAVSTFYHPNVRRFIFALNRFGIERLLNRSQQWEIEKDESIKFEANYKPTSWVLNLGKYVYPTSQIDFSYTGAYSGYNWELFFHVPMLIACRLSTDQRYEDARKWFHFIFDPTRKEKKNAGKERFWQFKPFYDEALKPINTLGDLLRDKEALQDQLDKWQTNPFQPHVIARMRVMSYMKNVVMKYLDNLINWGDQLARRDTIEDLNQATNLYVLAAKILGQRPEQIPPRVTHSERNFEEILDFLDAFSNAMVNIETYISPSAPPASGPGNPPQIGKMFYFDIPTNELLLKYWDTVADRLFKIRNGLNMEGVARTLSLYGTPIDPALLVRATASGMDLNSILSEINTDLPYYRFAFMLQKAAELVSETQGLASSLLLAVERRDEAALEQLRFGHEQKLLDGMLTIKERQVSESNELLEASKLALENAKKRQIYFSSREYMNAYEKQHLSSVQTGMVLSIAQGQINSMAGVLATIPNFKVGAPFSIGATFGGDNLSSMLSAVSNYLGIMASINSARGMMAASLGGYTRRMDDWMFQADTSANDVKQAERQLIAAEIRTSLSITELENYRLQVEQLKARDEFFKARFSSQQLYDWQINHLSTLYFQAYQMAFDISRKAEKCYQFETGYFNQKKFLQFGYWDSLKKGLLSAEKLQHDLRRMEISYLEENKRQLELTKHISLVLLDPQALLSLIDTGICQFYIHEELFDFDFPGHYFRRLKSVSITIPCITGPYVTINCKFTQISSYIRTDPSPGSIYGSDDYGADARFHKVIEQKSMSIATSHAQNDSGMFDFGANDERYFPFEGCGVFGRYMLELQTEKDLRQFDYSTINDIILHFNYIAQESNVLKQHATDHLKNLLRTTSVNQNGQEKSGLKLWRMFSLKHDFSNEWNSFIHSQADPKGEMAFRVKSDHFPFFVQNRPILLKKIKLSVYSSPGSSILKFTLWLNGESVPNDGSSIDLKEGKFYIKSEESPSTGYEGLRDIFLIVDYQLDD
ncbi:neuraminidase-like domain-containing protein [Pedobacter gandavensis]|uniref:Tc toxin subunit A-related protein n=1 Tax=Pedobacter gandavensis TaxID=2679963 RepID=UPI00292D5642|nr:neuraminidase-like domain-containing protein [Pedobacter gandavensis]